MQQGLLMLFAGIALRIKKVMRKARNAAGVSSRQGFATQRMAFLAATRRELAESGATRRYPPCPHVNAGGGGRLD
jgi:hypothetical protein